MGGLEEWPSDLSWSLDGSGSGNSGFSLGHWATCGQAWPGKAGLGGGVGGSILSPLAPGVCQLLSQVLSSCTASPSLHGLPEAEGASPARARRAAIQSTAQGQAAQRDLWMLSGNLWQVHCPLTLHSFSCLGRTRGGGWGAQAETFPGGCGPRPCRARLAGVPGCQHKSRRAGPSSGRAGAEKTQ